MSVPQAVRFVLVGHCGADSHWIARAIRKVVPEAVVTSADDEATLRSVEPGSVLLINRVLDGGFKVDGGIELIRSLAAGASPPPMVLISNYADAQDAAVAAGAMRGFGKSDLGAASTAETLRALAARALTPVK